MPKKVTSSQTVNDGYISVAVSPIKCELSSNTYIHLLQLTQLSILQVFRLWLSHSEFEYQMTENDGITAIGTKTQFCIFEVNNTANEHQHCLRGTGAV